MSHSRSGRAATFAAGLGISLIAALSAHAVDEPVLPNAPMAQQPVFWDRYPTGDEALKHYPPQALRANISGAAHVECEFDAPLPGESTSLPKSCRALDEYPKGMGFGAATEALILRYGRVRAAPGDSLKAGSITIRYRWTLEGRPLRPESEDIAFMAGTNPADYYPKESRKSAKIKLRCSYKVEDSIGDITSCTVTDEKPKGDGIGAAAQILFEERGLVVFGGSKLLIPSEGEISFGFDWTPPAGE